MFRVEGIRFIHLDLHGGCIPRASMIEANAGKAHDGDDDDPPTPIPRRGVAP